MHEMNEEEKERTKNLKMEVSNDASQELRITQNGTEEKVETNKYKQARVSAGKSNLQERNQNTPVAANLGSRVKSE